MTTYTTITNDYVFGRITKDEDEGLYAEFRTSEKHLLDCSITRLPLDEVNRQFASVAHETSSRYVYLPQDAGGGFVHKSTSPRYKALHKAREEFDAVLNKKDSKTDPDVILERTSNIAGLITGIVVCVGGVFAVIDSLADRKPDIGVILSPSTVAANVSRDLGFLKKDALVEACGRAVDNWFVGKNSITTLDAPTPPPVLEKLTRPLTPM